MARRTTYNLGDSPAPPEGAPTDALKIEFGRRLQKAMIAKGWSQAELARQASRHAASGKIQRDNISKYIRGLFWPTPTYLHAMAKALGVDAYDLLPTKNIPGIVVDQPPYEMRSVESGRAWLRLNVALPMNAALKIMAIVQEAEGVALPDDK